MTREELLELSRVVSGELPPAEAAEVRARASASPRLNEALRRLERLAEVTAEPAPEDVDAATRALRALESQTPVVPRVLGGMAVLVGVVVGLWGAFAERVQPTVEHVQRDVSIDDSGVRPPPGVRQVVNTGRLEILGVELESDGDFWWAELPGVEPRTEASHVTRDNPSLENLPMKTFATPRQTLLAVWIASGTVAASPPDSPGDASTVLRVTVDEKVPLSIEPGDTVAFEPPRNGRAWTLGNRSAIFSATQEGPAAVVISHPDGGLERVAIEATANVTTGEHRYSMFLETPRTLPLHDVVRWDIGDGTIVRVDRDGINFVLTGLRLGETSLHAWDSLGRSGVWHLTVLDRERTPIRVAVGMSRMLSIPDMARVDARGAAATARLLGSDQVLVTGISAGSTTLEISLHDGGIRMRSVVVEGLEGGGHWRRIPFPDEGTSTELTVGETLVIPMAGVKRVSQSGDSVAFEVKDQSLRIRAERRGDTKFFVETHGSTSTRTFTIEAR